MSISSIGPNSYHLECIWTVTRLKFIEGATNFEHPSPEMIIFLGRGNRNFPSITTLNSNVLCASM
jgi:hypothetical protein